jgi:hypothetical protein
MRLSTGKQEIFMAKISDEIIWYMAVIYFTTKIISIRFFTV